MKDGGLPAHLRVRAGRNGIGARVRTACAMLVLFTGSAHGEVDDAPIESPSSESSALSGEEVARRINARDDGRSFLGSIVIELTDRREQIRVRDVRTVRRDVEGQRQSVFVFDSPPDLRGTALLLHDHASSDREDDQWLYLPAARRVRRVATGDRGSYFAGTDLTFEDMKNGTKVSIGDYTWKTLGREQLDGFPCHVVEATPRSEAVARELGYGRLVLSVDEDIWIARRVEIWDPSGQRLKTVDTRDIRRVDGVWTAHEIEVAHHQTEHRTRLRLTRVDYDFVPPDDVFSRRALSRGLRTPE